jgi:hypothetical protein
MFPIFDVIFTCMPESCEQPHEDPVPFHFVISAIQPVKLRIIEKRFLRKRLLGQAVDDDRDGGVDGVEEEEEDALEERSSRKIGVNGKHQLACKTSKL